MQGKKRYTIGMFDSAKGIGILLVVFFHCMNSAFQARLVALSNFWILGIVGAIVAAVGCALMPEFLAISGFGVRKRPIGQCIRSQAKYLLIPYLITTVITIGTHLVTRYFALHSLRSAVYETWKVALSFLLMLPRPGEFFGLSLYTCGPNWFLVALFWAIVILDVLMNIIPPKYLSASVLAVSAVGWFIGRGKVVPFCISQGMIAVLYVYIGHIVKKKKLLLADHLDWKWYALFALSVFVCIIGPMIRGDVSPNMADSTWPFGYLSVLGSSILGIAMLFLEFPLNAVQNRVTRGLRAVGQDTLLILCIHTAEMTAIPWYLLQEKLQDRLILCVGGVFVLRIAIIFAALFAVKRIQRYWRERKKTGLHAV